MVEGRGEAVEVRAALLRMRRSGLLPVAFGGLLPAGAGGAPAPGGASAADGILAGAAVRGFRITETAGTTTESLRGLSIATGSGLGGKALAMARPCSVTDYRSSRVISHEYDAAVAAEGLRSVLAVPVVVHRRVRGVLYGALREAYTLGDRPVAVALDAARELEQALAVRDEARRLLSYAQAPATADPRAWEQVRAAHVELRDLAGRIPDLYLRQELLGACARLAGALGPVRERSQPPVPTAQLTPRELDVLAAVASGATNAAVATRLRLRPETVKSYLRAAMRKLGAHTRMEAVVAARGAGLLP